MLNIQIVKTEFMIESYLYNNSLEFYEVLAEFLGCYAAEHIGEYTLNLENI